MKLALSLIGAIAFAAAGCGTSTSPAAPDPMAMSGAMVGSSASEASGASMTPQSAAVGRHKSAGAVYVTSQGLYYDTFVAQDPLPMSGKFQKLVDGTTEFGPGDPGYLGGRWWVDMNGNGLQDEGDHFFLCPLLPPGHPEP